MSWLATFLSWLTTLYCPAWPLLFVPTNPFRFLTNNIIVLTNPILFLTNHIIVLTCPFFVLGWVNSIKIEISNLNPSTTDQAYKYLKHNLLTLLSLSFKTNVIQRQVKSLRNVQSKSYNILCFRNTGFFTKKETSETTLKSCVFGDRVFFLCVVCKKKIRLNLAIWQLFLKLFLSKFSRDSMKAQITTMNQVNKQNSELFYEVSLTLVNALSWYPMLALLKELSLCHKLKSPNLFSN